MFNVTAIELAQQVIPVLGTGYSGGIGLHKNKGQTL